MSAEMIPGPGACEHIRDCTTPKLCLSVGTCKGYYVMPASVRESANKAHSEPVREAFQAFCTKRWGGSSRDMFDVREDGEYFNGRVQFAWSAWQEATRQAMERAAKVCDVTPPYPFRPSIEAAHAIRALLPQSEKRHG